jgi:DNA-binding transcriptional LysR family regulator
MRNPSLSLQQMRLIVEIADHRNIRHAAAVLGISPSLASRQLKSVESELGLRLFERTTRHLEASEEGLALANWARASVGDLDAVLLELEGRKSMMSGHIRLACPELLAVRFVTDVLAEFSEKYPDISVDLETHEQTTELVGGHFDAAIHVGTPPQSNLIVRKLLSIDLVLCSSQKYLDKNGFPKIPEDLENHTLLSHKIYDQGKWRLYCNESHATIDITPKVESNSTLFLLELVSRGAGIACMSRRTVAEAIENGDLVRVLPKYHAQIANRKDIDVWLVLPQRRIHQRTRILLDSIVNHMQKFG